VNGSVRPIGWASLDEDGGLYRPMVGREGFYRKRRKPVTVYQTQKRAEMYSPVGRAVPCFAEFEGDA
jgi:hypothetical protein